MVVPTSYLTSTKNIPAIFSAIQKASVPEAFTYEFLKQLGFASSAARPVIPVMKAIGLLDQAGRPTQLYRDYKDPSVSKATMATALRNGYGDIFAIDTEAHNRSTSELSGLFSRVTDKGESVNSKMALTFKSLAELADFDSTPSAIARPPEPTVDTENPAPPASAPASKIGTVSLRHDVHVHLPLSTDIAVYDAIFRSLKANLL
ncbi:DUF5343 domain-containing protein [Cellulosimicrobium sp. KWT-B]|uniref:DUF5343 domain-containing protein n=1 Tax=Cellulosimicrobium sp. KWT-B TaxID=1981152 RepID=UPI001178B7A1|nr:DUF5343 domain-containing protein [Cellulosimicrobium sp. KWT-B]